MKYKSLFFACILVLVFGLFSGCTPNQPTAPMMTTAEEYGYPWWNDAVFYQIFVRSFYDSDGDGIGDFNGITEKMDYLNDGDPETDTDLEITGIWLMPIYPSPSYHGYDVTDFTGINPDYGTMEDFENFLTAAHERGIKVILDWEINHTSTEHPWFKASIDPESDYRDWYIWEEDEPDWTGPWGQDVWHRNLEAGASYYGIFWEGMPDLNYKNPAVTDAMNQAVSFWIEEVGVDGLRIDAARHLIEEGPKQQNTEATHEWYQEWFPWFKDLDAPQEPMVIGEVWDASRNAARFVDDQELDLVFDFDLAGGLVEAVNYGYGIKITSAIEDELSYFPEYQMGTFLSNHDMARVMTVFRDDYGKAKVAATALLTAPGIPFVYYGEEIGMEGGKPDENIRRPMQWDDSDFAGFTTGAAPWKMPQRDYTDKNVAMQDQDDASLLNHYRKLINMRNQYPVLKIGDYLPIDVSDITVYAAMRSTEEQKFIVLVNMTENEVTDYTISLKNGPLEGDYQVVEFFSDIEYSVPNLTANADGGFDAYTPLVTLEPYETYILWLSE
ncbi:MAG: hypothetical protein J7K85_09605 [Anaerolineaceae bacterium]|nr:hypothetical protein [Anaerolineaceae bacterium]